MNIFEEAEAVLKMGQSLLLYFYSCFYPRLLFAFKFS